MNYAESLLNFFTVAFKGLDLYLWKYYYVPVPFSFESGSLLEVKQNISDSQVYLYDMQLEF